MVIRKCECCNFSTTYKNVLDNHLKSKKHNKVHNLCKNIDNNNNIVIIQKNNVIFECEKCKKHYKTRSGLRKHALKCDVISQNTIIKIEEEIEIEEKENDVGLLRKQINELQKQLCVLQPQLVNLQPSITNSNNTTNNNNIHIYLNTHCGNAMSIDQFVDSMKFVEDDYNEIDKNRFYYQGATNILKKYFEQLKPEDRPIHYKIPIVNKPTSFFVRDENEWKEECQSMIHYQIKYIAEFENKEEQLAMTRFFEKFNEKLYETYKELSYFDKQMERRINDKMMGGGMKDKIDMLDELVDSKILALTIGK